MSQYSKSRGLASIAVQRLREAELRALHEQISGMSVTSFLELIRDIEDEIENSVLLTLARSEEGAYTMPFLDRFYEEIDQIRKKELGAPVQRFAELLQKSLSENWQYSNNKDIPKFDSRRGLHAWLKKLLSEFSEQEIFHAVNLLRMRDNEWRGHDWKLK